MMCLADETQVLVGDFLCVSIVLSSKKVPFGRYALRAIPPTSCAPPVHKSRATSRPKSTFLFADGTKIRTNMSNK